jgi:hypothetical protein
MAIDRGHQHRSGVIPFADLADRRAGIEQELYRLHVSFTSRKEQRCQAALSSNELTVAEGTFGSAAAPSTAATGASATGSGTASRGTRAAGHGLFLRGCRSRIATLPTLILAR